MSRKKIDKSAPFQSPTSAAAITGLSSRYLIQLCKDGKIPFIMVGNDFRINVPLLVEQLNEESKGMMR